MRKAQSKGATCFSCGDDFRYASIDAITSITLGKSLNSVDHALSAIDASEIEVDAFGGAKFDLPQLPLYTSLRYLFECIGDATTLPVFIAYMVQQTLRWTPNFRRHYKRVIDRIFGQVQIQVIGTAVGTNKNLVKSAVADARQAVKEARALGEEYEAKSLVEMVAEKEGLPNQENLFEWELRDEILAYILCVPLRLPYNPCSFMFTISVL